LGSARQGMKSSSGARRASAVHAFYLLACAPTEFVGRFKPFGVDWSNPVFRALRPSLCLISIRTSRSLPTLAAETARRLSLRAVVTSSAGAIDASLLWDGDFTKAVTAPPWRVKASPRGSKWILAREQTLHSMSLAGSAEAACPPLIDRMAPRCDCNAILA